MRNEVGQQPHTVPIDVAARPVSTLMLIKADVGIARGLTDVEPPPARAAAILEQGDVEVVGRAASTVRCRTQATNRTLCGGMSRAVAR